MEYNALEHFRTEFVAIRNICIRVTVVFFVSAFLFFLVPITLVGVGGVVLPMPGEGETFVMRAITHIEKELVPEGVVLISLTPFDSFIALLAIAGALAFTVLVPFTAFEGWRYIRAGLFAHERTALGLLLVSGTTLFMLGAYFAYAVLIPVTFDALYQFTPTGLTPFFSLSSLVSLVASLTVFVGLLFELPILMVVLTRLNIVRAVFWRTHFRHAFLLVIVLSAIITPDGSGISMALLAIPVCLAYLIGYAGSVLVERSRLSPLSSQ